VFLVKGLKDGNSAIKMKNKRGVIMRDY